MDSAKEERLEALREKSRENLEKHRRYSSQWLCHELDEPLWPTEGKSRGNDVYLWILSLIVFGLA